MSRRVVVTGMGAISPIGNDVPTMWKNMVDGVCGIETITAFDTSDLKVHIAGTVKDFDPTQYIEKKEVRKLDPYTQYAIAAAQQAVDDSGIIGKIDENRFGVYIGAGIGGYGITIFGMRTIWISCMLLLIGFLMMFIKEEQTEHMEPMTL